MENPGSRFGNPAFRDFYDKVTKVWLPCIAMKHHIEYNVKASPELHSELPGLPENAIVEVSAYFTEAWGNRTRIDYGSGMELNFLCWMWAIRRMLRGN